jgi:dinuclear metal center YbgI/SA1388 family protein
MGKFSVGDIEELMFAAFPREQAVGLGGPGTGDVIGLLVGDPKMLVTKIAVALDATVPTIKAAAEQGCNLLLTHHPAYIAPVMNVSPAGSTANVDGAAVWAAATNGVALINMHTNLDCAPEAASMLLDPVGLEYLAPFLPHNGKPYTPDNAPVKPVAPVPSLGQIARPIARPERHFITLGDLAHNYATAFGNVAKVWGDPERPLFTVAVCSGGGSSLVQDAINAEVDCYVTGELRHHEELWLADEGVSVIELGHDISELPYRYILAETLEKSGVPHPDIAILEPTATWQPVL